MKFSLKSIRQRFGKICRKFGYGIKDRVVALCLGQSFHAYRYTKEYKNWLSRFAVTAENKVHIPNIEFYLAYGCNLKCAFCSNLNPYRQGIVSKDELFDSFGIWSQKIQPDEVRLLGGETLLHPHYAEIAVVARKFWRTSRIVIYTNGILLSQIHNETLQRMANEKIEFRISKHLTNKSYNQIIADATKRFRSFGISYVIGNDYKHWSKIYKTDQNGMPIPSDSNPSVAHSVCSSKYCITIIADTLYKCSFIANFRLALTEGALSKDWNAVLSHNGISASASQEDILAYLRSGYTKECSVCPDKIEKIHASQLSIEDLKRIRQIVTQ
ncbi:MAG: radical SAM protein [Planctomycetaceae bacterium]|jgi:organic radical activating enzyme|nr:radical SAM protein [Planctomycetaceae bacterium]